MVRHPGLELPFAEVPHEAGERGSVGQAKRHVKEAEARARSNPLRPWALHEFDEGRPLFFPAPKHSPSCRTVEHAEPENVLIEGERPCEIGNLQLNAAQPGRLRQPIVGRRDADR
jgi:hypothetical protein